MNSKDLQKLVEQFNSQDISPQLTIDAVLSSDQSKSGNKKLTKKQKQEIFPNQLSPEDIESLREDAERKLAIKRGLLDLNSLGKTSQRTKDIGNVGKLKSSLKNLNVKSRNLNIQKSKEQKLEEQFITKAKVIKRPTNMEKTASGLDKLQTSNRVEDSFDSQNVEKFETDFLISTGGLINSEILLDLLKDTYDEHLLLKKLKQEKKKGSGGTSVAIMGGLFAFSDFIFGYLKKLGKMTFNFVGKNLSRFKSGFYKKVINPLVMWLKTFFSKFKSFMKYVLNPAKALGKAVRATYNAAKNGVKTLTTLINPTMATAGLISKSSAKSVSSISSKSASKLGAAALAKTGGKAIPLLNAGLVASDAYETIKDIRKDGILQTGENYKKEANSDSAVGNLLTAFNPMKYGTSLEALFLKGITKGVQTYKGWTQESSKEPEFIQNPTLRSTNTTIIERGESPPQKTIISRSFPEDTNQQPFLNFIYGR